MLLWTMQPISALEDLERTGVFRCEKDKSFNLSKRNSLDAPYHWLMERMADRIGPPPAGVTYPIWAWHTWDFQRKAPDPNSPAFLRMEGVRKGLFTLEVPEDQVTLTDFDAWQQVLIGGYVPGTADPAEQERIAGKLDELEGDALEEALRASWPNVFLIDRVESEYLTRGKYIQATFWELRREYVKEVQEI